MRVGIVNDLGLAREVLRRVVASVPGYSVAWLAEDGDDALARVATDRPDVILMDLVMPRMNGTEATRRIMSQFPCPILIVTSSVSENFPLVFQALGAGGLDAVDMPTFGPNGTVQNAEKLVARLTKLESALKDVSTPNLNMSPGSRLPDTLPLLVVIGASTGGPDALAQIVSTFPANFPAAILISQHIAADFAPGLVQQLAAGCRLQVRAAKDGDTPMAGFVHVAVSNDHLELSTDRMLRYTASPRSYPYRPSVDVLFTSAAAHTSRPGVGVLLTGMGSDGADGLLRLRSAGWHTIAQDQATSIVFGMPKAAIERQAAMEVLPLQHIGDAIVAKVLALKRR